MGRINEKVLRDIARGDRDCDRVGLRRLALDLLDAKARIAELEAAAEDGIALPPGVRLTSVSEQMALKRLAELVGELGEAFATLRKAALDDASLDDFERACKAANAALKGGT